MEQKVESLELAVVSGMSDGGSLRLGRRIAFTLTEARFHESMTREQYIEFGRQLKLFRTSLPHYTADWLKFGRSRFGADFVEQTVGQLQLPMEDIEAATMIALVDPSRRRLELEPAHHEMMGTLLSMGKVASDDVEKWLNLAVEHSLTPGELHDSVITGQVMRRAGSSRPGREVLTVIHGMSSKFKRWLQNVGGAEAVGRMAALERKQIFEEIAPIGELYEQLKGKEKA